MRLLATSSWPRSSSARLSPLSSLLRCENEARRRSFVFRISPCRRVELRQTRHDRYSSDERLVPISDFISFYVFPFLFISPHPSLLRSVLRSVLRSFRQTLSNPRPRAALLFTSVCSFRTNTICISRFDEEGRTRVSRTRSPATLKSFIDERESSRVNGENYGLGNDSLQFSTTSMISIVIVGVGALHVQGKNKGVLFSSERLKGTSVVAKWSVAMEVVVQISSSGLYVISTSRVSNERVVRASSFSVN